MSKKERDQKKPGKPKCPTCGSKNSQARISRGTLWCRSCGTEFDMNGKVIKTM